MTSFIDTHCHLDILESTPEETIIEAKQAGVQRMVTIAVDEPSLDFVSSTVQEFPAVYGSVGFHPHDASKLTKSLLQKIRQLAEEQHKLIAIGETGLDYHYMNSPAEIQQQAFRKQLQLAVELNLPVILHSREAETDTLNILQEFPVPSLGVAHSFTSSIEMAKILVDMGWYLGINGIVTFKNAEDLQEVVRWLPLEHLLLETDSPFLAPVPHRGKTNEPSFLLEIAKTLSHIKHVPMEEVGHVTTKNFYTLFHKKIKMVQNI